MDFLGNFTHTLYALIQGEKAKASAEPAKSEAFESEKDEPVGEYDVSLGERKFGEAGLECTFLQSISRWGKFGRQGAGLLHFSLTATQRSDIQLEWAEFSIIFRNYTDGSPSPEILAHHLKPVSFSGKAIEREVETRAALEQELGGGFGGVEGKVGLALEKKRNYNERFYWTITGRSGAAAQNDPRVTRAVWLWQANKKAFQASPMTFRSGLVVTSVVEGDFEIELKLQGKLKHFCQRVAAKPRWFANDAPAMTRLVHSSSDGDDLKKHILCLEKDLDLLNNSQRGTE